MDRRLEYISVIDVQVHASMVVLSARMERTGDEISIVFPDRHDHGVADRVRGLESGETAMVEYAVVTSEDGATVNEGVSLSGGV